jgi:hypothetical protein
MISSDVAIVRNPKGKESKGRTTRKSPTFSSTQVRKSRMWRARNGRLPLNDASHSASRWRGVVCCCTSWFGETLEADWSSRSASRRRLPMTVSTSSAAPGCFWNRPSSAARSISIAPVGSTATASAVRSRPSSSDSSPKKSPGPSWPSFTFCPVVVSTEISTAPRAMT